MVWVGPDEKIRPLARLRKLFEELDQRMKSWLQLHGFRWSQLRPLLVTYEQKCDPLSSQGGDQVATVRARRQTHRAVDQGAFEATATAFGGPAAALVRIGKELTDSDE